VNTALSIAAGTIEPRPRPRAAGAAELADLLIASARLHPRGAIWLEPIDDRPDCHRVTLEQGRHALSATVLPAGLGDAVIARLALLCDLDLLARGAQTGRCSVRAGGERFDLLVTTRPTDRGLGGELRALVDGDVEDELVIVEGGPPLPAILPAGTTIGPYRVAGQLGEGGMGVVYRVEHTLLAKQFAMKVLRHELIGEDPDSVRRFLREARAAARIDHDGIVAVTDSGTLDDGRPYLVMELLCGQSLDEVMDEEGALEVRRAVGLMRRIATALGAAHERGVLHRDVSPSNVFLQRAGDGERVKLVDFGTADIVEQGQPALPDGPPGIVFGTPYYMAPEQAKGIETDHRSDLYSLGVVFFEMLAGEVPFDDETLHGIMGKHVHAPAPPVRSPHEPVPDALVRVVARLLRKDPTERYQSAAELVEDLARVELVLERQGWRRWLPS
jgi:serine/threonine protein kinase